MKTFYDSPWHLPATAWLSVALFGAWILARPTTRRAPSAALFGVLGALIAVDAWLNGALSPLKPGATATTAALAFVLLGDFRFFYLIERELRPRDARAAFAAAARITLLVPVLVLPLRIADVEERILWLVYEGLVMGLCLLLRFAVLPMRIARAGANVARSSRLYALTGFEIVQYALWMLSDVLLLRDVESAWALRMIPNTMYYALFVPFAWRTIGAREAASA